MYFQVIKCFDSTAGIMDVLSTETMWVSSVCITKSVSLCKESVQIAACIGVHCSVVPTRGEELEQVVTKGLQWCSWCRKYILCWAFLIIVSVLGDHFRSWEIVNPWNLKVSTAATVVLNKVRGDNGEGFLLKSTVISTSYILYWGLGCSDCTTGPVV